MFARALQFVRESRQELRRVNWPTREETIRLTLVVVFISLAVAFFLGLFDLIFIFGLNILFTFKA